MPDSTSTNPALACGRCGYPIASNSPRCPECGCPVSSATVRLAIPRPHNWQAPLIFFAGLIMAVASYLVCINGFVWAFGEVVPHGVASFGDGGELALFNERTESLEFKPLGFPSTEIGHHHESDSFGFRKNPGYFLKMDDQLVGIQRQQPDEGFLLPDGSLITLTFDNLAAAITDAIGDDKRAAMSDLGWNTLITYCLHRLHYTHKNDDLGELRMPFDLSTIPGLDLTDIKLRPRWDLSVAGGSSWTGATVYPKGWPVVVGLSGAGLALAVTFLLISRANRWHRERMDLYHAYAHQVMRRQRHRFAR